MRRIAHLSDLHFGREDPAVVQGVADDVRRVRADLVVVSGDLTQRARRAEFTKAREFLDGIGVPWLAVPGNHDIPLYNLGRRLWSPFGRYARLIAQPLEPRFLDDELAVLGLNTALPTVWKGGAVRPAQIDRLHQWAQGAGNRLRVVVSHHPFTSPEAGGHALVRGWSAAVQAMELAEVDVVLTGHHHLAGHSESRAVVAEGPRRLVVVRAGTTTSVRMRGSANSYNLLRSDASSVTIDERRWDGSRFSAVGSQSYPRQPHGQPTSNGGTS